MPLFELKAEVSPEVVVEIEELVALMEDGRLMILEDKPSGKAWVAGYFEDESVARQQWSRLASLSNGAVPLDPPLRVLEDQDWRDSYKAHFHAWRFGRLHWVPVWERETYALPAGDAAIWLDPGLAFGTGNHETTRLCCERLVAYHARQGIQVPTRRVLDAGCGSGILALSAARLGFVRVDGFDNDPEAVRVSHENAELNGLTGAVSFYTADLTTGLTGRQADLLMANIQADVLTAFVSDLVGAIAPQGELVLSGILAEELESVKRAYTAAAPDWTVDSRTLGAWSDLVLRRP